jgi:hypothetical protein
MERALVRRFPRSVPVDATRTAGDKTLPRPARGSDPDRRAWLLAIGRRLQSRYDAAQEPLPSRLDALVKRLDEI